jgi:hypothetical protein
VFSVEVNKVGEESGHNVYTEAYIKFAMDFVAAPLSILEVLSANLGM